eukprot:scaffold2575_cov101-Cylindrotheca_fusiformis.AAC.6
MDRVAWCVVHVISALLAERFCSMTESAIQQAGTIDRLEAVEIVEYLTGFGVLFGPKKCDFLCGRGYMYVKTQVERIVFRGSYQQERIGGHCAPPLVNCATR